MKLIVPKLIAVCLVFVLLSSCDVTQEIEDFRTEESPDTETPVSEEPIDNLNIPSGFNFSTQKEVKVTINDVEDNIKYDIFGYTDEKKFLRIETYEDEEGQTVTDSVFNSGILDRLFFNGVVKGGKLSHTVIVPDHVNKLYIRRKDNLRYSSEIVNISGGEVNYFGSASTGKNLGKNNNNDSDLFYAVNGSGELFQIDPLTGTYTLLANMPMGSYTCAIDQENKLLYSIGRSRPNPLMKYSIENNTWETITDLGMGGPRLDFNEADGMLYFSNWDQVYTIDPSNGSITDTKDMDGGLLGGDLVFAEDGTMYMCSFAGVYRVELNSNGEYQRTYISSSVPLNLTSMEFDSNGQLWLADAWFGNSDLMTMDVQTGAWQYTYGVSAGNGTNFNRKINDLAILNAVEVVEIPDADGDGIADSNDAYPNDADKAFEAFAPSQYGWGTFAFEDLWPHTGDYDFNDVALRYRFKTVLNSDNDVVQIDFTYNVKATGAGFTNGFGLEIESLSPAQVESVTGLDLKQAYINLNANGTESGQNNAVFIMFDDARSMLGNEVTVSINLAQPINLNSLGAVPFNPFVIVNKERDREIHLPFKSRTTLGTDIGGIKDADGNYVTETGLPWGINVAYDFKVPNERVTIIEAYNFFGIWAASGGLANVDWYRNNPGNINDDKVAQD